MGKSDFVIPTIESRIYTVRGQKVMLDHDLAKLYGVPTKVLNQAVKRNVKRFPADFMFKLSREEKEAVTNCDHLRKLAFSPFPPLAFTESGVAMLSSILNSERAIQVNIQIMRVFVQSRAVSLAHRDIMLKIDALEKKYDSQFQVVFKAIKLLLETKKFDDDRRF